MSEMTVARSGNCAPANKCAAQRYRYEWDEVGRLTRARRWDQADPLLPADAELLYEYDSSDQRVRKTVVDGEDARHTVYVFATLELRLAEYEGTQYEVTDETEVPYLFGHGVRLARVTYTNAADFQTERRRIFLELGDHLGSTSVVLDHATGELVERSTAYAYGAAESHYRPGEWNAFREDYRFTGKEDDIEVGLIYFGARYLNPQLGRWISADPLAVHAPGKADLNLYAYVHGRVLSAVDPLGLDDKDRIKVEAFTTDPGVVARMPVAFLRAVLSPSNRMGVNSTTWLDEGYAHKSNRLDLRPGTIAGLANAATRLNGGAAPQAITAVDTFYHETTHAYFTIYKDQQAVAGIIARGIAHYTNAPLKEGGTASDPSRMFQEAAAMYVGHRAGWHYDTVLRMQDLEARVKAGSVTAEAARRQVGQYRADYDAAMARRDFGYEEQGWVSKDQHYTDRPISDEMKKFLDERILDNQVTDKFDDNKQVKAIEQRIEEGQK